MKHIVNIEDLNNKDIINILDRAKKLVPIAEGKKTSNSLSGKIVATCFFEPSTRTRLSFETAISRLGGNYIGFADPSATSHIKGETQLTRCIGAYQHGIWNLEIFEQTSM